MKQYTSWNDDHVTNKVFFVFLQTKDDPGNLHYSEVDSSNSGPASLHSAPCGYTDNALYSDPRVAQSSDVSHAEDASLALYSTVS